MKKSIASLFFVSITITLLSAAPSPPLTLDTFGAEKPPPKPSIKEIRPGVFQVGGVLLEKEKSQISFPVIVNMHEGLLEYILVSGKGKTHESLLVTRTEPFHIHVAMLLLGAKGAQGKEVPEDPKKNIPGDHIRYELNWKVSSKDTVFPVEQFVLNRQTNKAMRPGHFIYNGSLLFQGAFIAHVEGNLFSLITSPAALANNPRKGRENDENWEPIKKGLPPLDTEVKMTVKLLRPAQGAAGKK